MIRTRGRCPELNGDAVPATGIDWARTRAYANGLAGFYLNIAGRERQGSVPPEQATALRDELMDRLRGLEDPAGGEAIREVWASADCYRGPYRSEAPDVIVGYNPGWRADWDMATGATIADVFRENTKPWSADHCMDPRQVPGVLFCNRSLRGRRHRPGRPVAGRPGPHHPGPLRRAGARAHAWPQLAEGIVMMRLLLVLLTLSVGSAEAAKVLVLGYDGMDPRLVAEYRAQGLMPNFDRVLAAGGQLMPLGTAIPPQSPVAWSTFITGLDPGGHGIFDFIHRDPETLAPYLSTSAAMGPAEFWKLGSWRIPRGGGSVENLRQGVAFWQLLDEAQVDATICSRCPPTSRRCPRSRARSAGWGRRISRARMGSTPTSPTIPWLGATSRVGCSARCMCPMIAARRWWRGRPTCTARGAPASSLPLTVTLAREQDSAQVELAGQRILLQARGVE